MSGSVDGSHCAKALICAEVMFAPSSVRNKFSKRIFKLNGRELAPSIFEISKISYVFPETLNVLLELKELVLMIAPS